MGYEGLWKLLADLLTELRERGETIPAGVMKDLRSAKTMIQILKADPARKENLPRIEGYLGKVESYLVFAAQEKLGSEQLDQWMTKLERARGRVYEEEEMVPSRFVPGLPRDKRWVRIRISEETPREDIERFAEERGLSCRMQENGCMLVYGDGENVKSLMKKIAERFRGARRE